MKKSFMEKQINKNFMLTLILVAMLLFWYCWAWCWNVH